MLNNEIKYAFAVECGKRNAERNVGCQDVVKIHEKDNALAVCLCDGAGSKKYAFETADIVSDYCMGFVSRLKLIDDFNKTDFLEGLSGIISDYSEENQFDIDEMGTTLILFWTDGKDYYCGHIGDGVVIATDKEREWLLSVPEKGEYYNETDLIPGEEFEKQYRENKGEVNDIKGFVIASDGISDTLYDKDGVVVPACSKFVNWVSENERDYMNEILHDNIQQIFNKYNNDDKSIVVLAM